jgi:DNA-directed RNA polymerase specialized sigma24 family protein
VSERTAEAGAHGEGSVPPGGTLTWEALCAFLHRFATRVARDPERGADLAQEALRRFIAHYGVPAVPPDWARAWGVVVVRHLARDDAKRPVASSLDTDDPDVLLVASREADPTVLPEHRDLVDWLLRTVERLPPPCLQVATLLLGGATQRTVGAYLHEWRGVGLDETRRLVRRTKEILRHAEAGGDPREVWPAGWDAEKNPWATTPPPPLDRFLE